MADLSKLNLRAPAGWEERFARVGLHPEHLKEAPHWSPLALGAAGAIPFLALSAPVANLVGLPDRVEAHRAQIQASYAVAIVSFLGGCHWGFAASAGGIAKAAAAPVSSAAVTAATAEISRVAAALGVAPEEDADADIAETGTETEVASGIASLGMRVTPEEKASGVGRAKTALGVAVIVAAVGAFGVVAVVGAVTKLAGSDRGTAAERIPLVLGRAASGGVTVDVDKLVDATPLAPKSPGDTIEEATWQKRAARRWRTHHLGSAGSDDASDDWADVV